MNYGQKDEVFICKIKQVQRDEVFICKKKSKDIGMSFLYVK